MVTVIDLARDLGIPVAEVHVIAGNLGLPLMDLTFGQVLRKALTPDDADAVRLAVRMAGGQSGLPSGISMGGARVPPPGWFYVVQPVPGQPSLVKVGHTTNVNRRLVDYRASSPDARLVQSWPCRRRWERTAIDALTFDCAKLGAETFETADLALLCRRGDAFFALMPRLDQGF